VTISHDHQDHNRKDEVLGTPFIIERCGEYEISEVSIFGVRTFHDSSSGSERGENTTFIIEIEGLSLCHLGDLGHKLTDKQLEELDGVDILFVPVGGVVTVGPKEAAEIVAQIEPRIVVPMHYKEEGINLQVFGSLAEVSEFLKEMGVSSSGPQPKLSISLGELPENLQVVVLERKSG
jgi:L-ascorbate metabolism protein UlaG (beta-lactamase superfamily)